MLVIGHRGAAGLAPENTLEALRAGVAAGADILEFDVRLTSDNVPMLCHDSRIHGLVISRTTLADLEKAGPITLLATVLDEFFGKILLNLEYKPVDNVEIVYDLLRHKYVKRMEEWDNVMFSSFHIRTLSRLRSHSKDVNLSLLHSINPFTFVTQQRRLKLSAVGWHRLHVNNLAIAIAQKVGLFSYVYTVNRPQAAVLFEQKGIDAVVTDYPNLISREF